MVLCMPILLKQVVKDIELFFDAYKVGNYNFSPKGGIYFPNKKPSQVAAFGDAVCEELDEETKQKLTFIKNYLGNIRMDYPLTDYDFYPSMEQYRNMVYGYEDICTPLLERCLIEIDKCIYKSSDFSILAEKDIFLAQVLSTYKGLTQDVIEELSTRYAIRINGDFVMPKRVKLPKPFETVLNFAREKTH